MSLPGPGGHLIRPAPVPARADAGPAAADRAARRRRPGRAARRLHAARLARPVPAGRDRGRDRAGGRPGRAARRAADPRRRQPSDDFRVRRLRGVLRAALLAGLVAIPVGPAAGRAAARSSAAAAPLPHPAASRPRRPTRLTRPPHPAPAFRLPLAGILYALLDPGPHRPGSWPASCCCGAASLIMTRCRPRKPRWPRASASDLRDAVSSGRRALAELDDARAAIIACYVAMERSLAAAGRGPRGRGHAG